MEQQLLEEIFLWCNLIHWNIVVVDCSCMCKRNGESVEHTFRHWYCDRFLASCALFLWGAVGYASKGDWFTGMLEWSFWQASKLKYLECYSLALLWTIWREHNGKTFEIVKHTMTELKTIFSYIGFMTGWLHSPAILSQNLLDFLYSCNFRWLLYYNLLSFNKTLIKNSKYFLMVLLMVSYQEEMTCLINADQLKVIFEFFDLLCSTILKETQEGLFKK